MAGLLGRDTSSARSVAPLLEGAPPLLKAPPSTPVRHRQSTQLSSSTPRRNHEKHAACCKKLPPRERQPVCRSRKQGRGYTTTTNIEQI